MTRFFLAISVASLACDAGSEPEQSERECIYAHPRSPCLELYAAQRKCGRECAEELDELLGWSEYLGWFERPEWPTGPLLPGDATSVLDTCADAPSFYVGCIVTVDPAVESLEALRADCIEQVGDYPLACEWMTRADLLDE